jgi:hypothetical protein
MKWRTGLAIEQGIQPPAFAGPHPLKLQVEIEQLRQLQLRQ